MDFYSTLLLVFVLILSFVWGYYSFIVWVDFIRPWIKKIRKYRDKSPFLWEPDDAKRLAKEWKKLANKRESQ
ncbi:MAG: hypothetical protein GXN97_05050 [Aquificae bacterium]|jgi:hypothetical protein|nr:hypothetical protein [Aquificota bacterium]